MGRRDLGSMSGHPDETHESLITSFDAGIERTLWAQRHVPFDRVSQAVELDEVEAFHPQTLQGLMDLAFSVVVSAEPGLSGEKESSRILAQPWRHPKLGIAVRGSNVEMIDSVT